MTPDVNVLVAASRSDHPHHRKALAWLKGALESCESGGTVEILPMVAAGFLRLVTNPKVFPNSTPIAKAVVFLKMILQTPGAEMPRLGGEWQAFEKLCLENNLNGNQIPDAWIAATVRSSGYHLVTFDRDFAGLLSKSEYTLLSP